MKKTFVRLISLLLLICMLASFVVPATFAGTEGEQTILTYDFEQYKDGAPCQGAFRSDKDLTYSKASYHSCGKATAKECLKECFYDAGLINWAVDDFSDGSKVLFRSQSNRTDKALRLNGTDNWVSIRLNVTEAGKYTIALRAISSRSAETWMFPASLLTDDKTAQDFMTADYQLNDTAFQDVSGSLIATLGEDIVLTQGEHIIAFKIKSGDRFYINEITLTETAEAEVPTTTPSETTTQAATTTEATTTAPEETTEATTAPAAPESDYWNFRFYQIPGYENVANMGGYSTFNANCQCGQNHKIVDHINASYADLGWKIAGTAEGDVSGISARCAENRGTAFKIESDGWVGINLKVTANGLQELITTGNTTQTGFVAYLFSGALAEDQISEKMADRNAVSANLIKSGVQPAATPSSMGVYDFTAGEYTLVIYNTNAKMRTMYLGSIQLQGHEGEAPTEPSVPETTVPEETTPPFVPTESYWDLKVYKTLTNIVPNDSKKSPLETCECGLGHTIKEHIDSAYSQLGWKFAGASTADMSTVSIRQTDDLGLRLMAEAQGWVGFNLNVTQSGKCDIYVLGKGNQQAGYYGYIFEGALTADQIAEKMADVSAISQNALGIPITPATTPAVIGSWDFNQGEYTLVLRNNRADKARTLHISGIGLLGEKAIPAVDEKIYDFDLSKDDPTLIKKGPTSRYNADGSIRTYQVLEERYPQTGWKYEQMSSKFTPSNASFRAGCFRFKTTENFRDLEGKQWYAFRIANPGTDTYDIRLTTSAAGMIVANIYLIPAPNQMTMSAANVEAAMTEENLLVKGALFDKKDTFYLGEYTFGMKEEYVLVFEFTKGTQLFLNEIKMTKDGVLSDGTVKKDKTYNGFVYDFDMGDSLNGYFPDSKTYIPDVIDELNAMWRNGTLKWRWERSSSGEAPATTHRFYRTGGMRFFHKENAWAAVRIKSPGSGTYTLTMNHAIMTSGGTCAVYILPGDTEDIEFAMDPKNRVGKVAMYNDGISTAVEDGKTSFVGYWDFEAGKEYIMVFESYKASPYSDNSYVNISQVIAQKGKIEYASTEDKKVDSVVVQENVVPVADALGMCVVTEIYGHDYYFLPVEGGATLVYDLDTGELMDTIPTGYARTTDMRQDQDGNIWISGGGKYIVRYNPYTQETKRTPQFTTIDWMAAYSGANSICPTPDGKLWFGTYYSSVLGVYDPETNEYRKVGKVADQNISKIHSIIYHNDFLYMTTEAGDGETTVVKFDMKTEQVVGSVDTSHMMGTAKYLATLSMLGDGDLLVAGVNGNALSGFIAVDPNTMELVEVEGIFGYMNNHASEEIDGKHYIVSSGYGLYEYDIATKTFSKTPGFGNQGIGFRSTEKSLITLDGEECLFTYTTSGGHPRYFALESVEYKTWDNLVVHGAGGADIRNVTAGPEGDNRLYIGVFNSDQGGIYDITQGKLTGYYKSGGQGDSQIWYEGKFYGGNYSSTTLNEIQIEDYNVPNPATNEVIQRWRLDHEETKQKRVHELAAGDGYIFAGTIPDTGYYGGSVTVYDTKTGRWFTHRNVVENCAVTGLEHYDTLLYGATSTSGGTGTSVANEAGVSAKIFVYDYENREVVATLDPRDYIKGLPSTIAFIGGFGQDPVVAGRMWAVVSETLFCFTYDTENKTFQVQEVISFDKSECDSSSAKHIWTKRVLFDAERSTLYYSFDAKGGFQAITLADWDAPIGEVKVASNGRIMGDAPQFYELGEDGELYYGKKANLMMLPMNVTDEDWAIAGSVDKMITDLGEITLEKEADIKSARSAYDNLSWRYKAMIQKLELLQESETDLLECKIDTIVLEDVDADSLPELQEYVDTYNGFNSRQQKYTKNYNYLLEAYAKATALNDERVAKAMQERMDALKAKFPLTLDNEPEVLELRADYDALTGPQRVLVDASALEDAEAQIKVLRAEFVKYVEELIQKIPAEITLAAEEVIMTAREAADKLYANERKNVSYSKLSSAEGKLRTLKKAKAAAEEVDALIKEIGIVTLGDKDRIAAARDAYDALNGTALTFLVGGKKLARAEFILKALQTWGIPAITVANAGIVFAVIWFVPSLHNKVFKAKKKEEEPTES